MDAGAGVGRMLCVIEIRSLLAFAQPGDGDE
jgi:hypothetical protein